MARTASPEWGQWPWGGRVETAAVMRPQGRIEPADSSLPPTHGVPPGTAGRDAATRARELPAPRGRAHWPPPWRRPQTTGPSTGYSTSGVVVGRGVTHWAGKSWDGGHEKGGVGETTHGAGVQKP